MYKKKLNIDFYLYDFVAIAKKNSATTNVSQKEK